MLPLYREFTKSIDYYFTNGWKSVKDTSFNAWKATEMFRNSVYKSTIQAKDYVIIIIIMKRLY